MSVQTIVIMAGGNIHGRMMIEEMINAGVPPALVINEIGTRRAAILQTFLQNSYDTPPTLEELGTEVRHIDRFDGDETLDLVATIKPEYIIMGGAGVVKQPLLGCGHLLNIHPGLLPFFRGLDPVLWSVYYRKPVGATVHLMSEGIDEGDILLSRRMPWQGAENLTELRLQVMRWGGKLLGEYLGAPESYPAVPQDLSKGSYFGSFPDDLIDPAEAMLKECCGD